MRRTFSKKAAALLLVAALLLSLCSCKQPELSVAPASMRGYDSLSAEHRAVYAEIVSLLFSHSERLLLWGRLRTAELEQLHTMVMCDYPEIFWVSGYSYSYSSSGAAVTYRPTYSCTAAEAAQLTKQLNARLDPLVAAAKVFSDDYDRALFMHDFIINTTVYDDSDSGPTHDALSALLYGRAVCSGYAAAYQLALKRLGIECFYVTGTPVDSGELHAWNIAFLNGVYTAVDLTYDDPVFSQSDLSAVSHGYFCLSDADIAAERSTDSSLYPYPECAQIDYYSSRGLYADDAATLGAAGGELYTALTRGQYYVELRLSEELYAQLCADSEALRPLLNAYYDAAEAAGRDDLAAAKFSYSQNDLRKTIIISAVTN